MKLNSITKEAENTDKIMKIFELTPLNRKSFYSKAKVIISEDNKAKLLSYDTIVAEINLVDNTYIQYGEYSATTNRHIKAFKQHYNL